MSVQLTSRDRYALLSWIVSEFGASGNLGKKTIQKFVHILDEGMCVNSGYRFSLRTYGAFCNDLEGDIDIASNLRAIAIEYISENKSYVVRRGEHADRVMQGSEKFFKEAEQSLLFAKEHFAEKHADEIDVFSMLVFLLKRNPDAREDMIEDTLREFRPQSDMNYLRESVQSVKAFFREVQSHDICKST